MKNMAKTPKQVLEEQKKQAERDRTSKAVTPTPTQPADDGWRNAASDADTRLSRGVRLKFKDGKFFDENGSELPDGTVAVALGLRQAWIRWAGHRPVEVVERKPGVPLPARETLGHSNRAQWEIGPSGEPTDPWVNTNFMNLVGKSGGIYTFTTSSMGGGAIERLADAIDFMRRVRPGAVPEIELRSAPMPTRFGARTKPNFPIVGWRGGDDATLAKQLSPPSTEELLDDEIPS
jgi:hypothetical protein